MIKSFTPNNSEHAFRKSEISPLNKNAILPEAIAPSKLTETHLNDQSVTKHDDVDPEVVPSDPLLEKSSVDNLFLLPSASLASKATRRTKSKDSSAKWLTDPELPTKPQAGPSGLVNSRASNIKCATKGKSTKKNKKEQDNDDDWHCGVCGISYREDVSAKNGALWVQCSFSVPLSSVSHKLPNET